ncbi:Protein-tyrosine-phosphatase [Lentibacillus sp. JNUCC-1]|nr:Protein-tyrosine-phosphatase [Lentibacillus sp. JNUCC-1]
MIDIHSHILPGVDDGAQTEQDSLAMAREAVRQGITTIIATPHHRNGSFDNPGT